MSELNEIYRVKRKGLKTLIEILKQRLLAKSAKVRRYQQRIDQFRQNRIFDFDQKKVKKVKDFGVIFGVSRKGTNEKQNG